MSSMNRFDRFLGNYDVAIDDKGRVHLPSKIRLILTEIYEEPLIMTIAASRGIIGYPRSEWVRKYDQLDELLKGAELEQKLRLVTAYATETQIKNGRILIPARLRDYAMLQDSAVIVGRSKKIEIWSPERFKDVIGRLSDDDIGKELEGLGF